MKRLRRRFLHLAAGAVALPAVIRVARAQSWPSRPVRIIVGFPAGSSSDIVARIIAQWLSQRMGQQFIVDNRPGASGNLGAELAAKAAPDGYTLLFALSSNTINTSLYDNLSFDFLRDIAPVASIDRVPLVMEVNPAVPAKTFPSSSPMPRPIPASSTWRPAATAAPSISPASCSRCSPA